MAAAVVTPPPTRIYEPINDRVIADLWDEIARSRLASSAYVDEAGYFIHDFKSREGAERARRAGDYFRDERKRF